MLGVKVAVFDGGSNDKKRAGKKYSAGPVRDELVLPSQLDFAGCRLQTDSRGFRTPDERLPIIGLTVSDKGCFAIKAERCDDSAATSACFELEVAIYPVAVIIKGRIT